MTNPVPFTEFLDTLQKTNRSLDFFVDWQKCLENRQKTRLYATHLNALLGVSVLDLPAKVAQIFQVHKEAFSLLPLLLAIRNPKELVKGGELTRLFTKPSRHLHTATRERTI